MSDASTTKPELVLITDLEAQKRAGVTYPTTVDAWRWMYRNREERGLAEAFVKNGRRVLVDIPKFMELQRSAGR